MVEQFGYTRALARKSVGAGWAPLVEKVFDKLELLSTEPGRRIPKITLIREKYGYLDIKTDVWDKDLYEVIDHVEEESEKRCYECGNPATQVTINDWVHTLCETHTKR